jgi:hypothetical protein
MSRCSGACLNGCCEHHIFPCIKGPRNCTWTLQTLAYLKSPSTQKSYGTFRPESPVGIREGWTYHIGHREVPQAGPGFVLVKIESCALNPVDKKNQLTGVFIDKYPYIGGKDGSGTVEQVGEGVSEPNVGDRVCVGLSHPYLTHKAFRADLKLNTVSSKLPSCITGARSRIMSS